VLQARDGNCLFVAVARVSGDKRLSQITTNNQGVAFRDEDKALLAEAQVDLRERVAGFIQKHADHYVSTLLLADTNPQNSLLPLRQALCLSDCASHWLTRMVCLEWKQSAFIDPAELRENMNRLDKPSES